MWKSAFNVTTFLGSLGSVREPPDVEERFQRNNISRISGSLGSVREPPEQARGLRVEP
jgi:hypothetical protein